MLTVEEMTRIWHEVMANKPPPDDQPDTQEMAKFRRNLKAEKKEAKEKGWSLEMPFD